MRVQEGTKEAPRGPRRLLEATHGSKMHETHDKHLPHRAFQQSATSKKVRMPSIKLFPLVESSQIP